MTVQNKDGHQPPTAEHYCQYRQRLASQGPPKKEHAISTKNNIKGIKIRWKKYESSLKPKRLTAKILIETQIQ